MKYQEGRLDMIVEINKEMDRLDLQRCREKDPFDEAVSEFNRRMKLQSVESKERVESRRFK